ncbi:iron ABC transporter permease [Sporomusa sp. KB1]|jgi:iron complex transport system permease protein|uniref:FecCD family ABC transporter permease n=1 Tax=Sporomusa sp. KB1 TaxID=943346 RepID=UPI0011AAD04D|nr:iron ABC transporter permease [Sporomusa sp. KB1]TWH46484.1 iron complex transport system permease protein [Sporomusa sp. KB1]
MNAQLEENQAYKRKIAIRNTGVVLAFLVLLIISFLVSMNTGYSKLSPLDVLRTLFGDGSDRENLILFSFRLPRIVISSLVGAGLALSGCIIQGVARNALAEPGLLGINAGAGLTVILFVLFFGAQSILSVFALPLLALIGAGITAILIYALAFKRQSGLAPIRLILTGVAVQAGILALTTVLVVKLDDTQFDFVAAWQAGSIWGSDWKFVLALLPWLLLLIPYVLSKARVLDVLSLGDDIACGLGLSVEKERRCLLAAAVALASSCVAVSGNISFAGLIAPHVARRLVGPRHGVLFPVCALAGALLVSASDTLARVIVQPAEIPTGIMVAIVGAPYFLYLLTKSKQ